MNNHMLNDHLSRHLTTHKVPNDQLETAGSWYLHGWHHGHTAGLVTGAFNALHAETTVSQEGWQEAPTEHVPAPAPQAPQPIHTTAVQLMWIAWAAVMGLVIAILLTTHGQVTHAATLIILTVVSVATGYLDQRLSGTDLEIEGGGSVRLNA